MHASVHPRCVTAARLVSSAPSAMPKRRDHAGAEEQPPGRGVPKRRDHGGAEELAPVKARPPRRDPAGDLAAMPPDTGGAGSSAGPPQPLRILPDHRPAGPAPATPPALLPPPGNAAANVGGGARGHWPPDQPPPGWPQHLHRPQIFQPGAPSGRAPMPVAPPAPTIIGNMGSDMSGAAHYCAGFAAGFASGYAAGRATAVGADVHFSITPPGPATMTPRQMP